MDIVYSPFDKDTFGMGSGYCPNSFQDLGSSISAYALVDNSRAEYRIHWEHGCNTVSYKYDIIGSDIGECLANFGRRPGMSIIVALASKE